MPQPKRDLAAFRAAHDTNVIIPAKLRAALADLEAKDGPQSWEYEAEFLKRAKVANAQLGAFRDEFAEHVVEVGGRNPKRIWFATKKTAAAARATQG